MRIKRWQQKTRIGEKTEKHDGDMSLFAKSSGQCGMPSTYFCLYRVPSFCHQVLPKHFSKTGPILPFFTLIRSAFSSWLGAHQLFTLGLGEPTKPMSVLSANVQNPCGVNTKLLEMVEPTSAIHTPYFRQKIKKYLKKKKKKKKKKTQPKSNVPSRPDLAFHCSISLQESISRHPLLLTQL